MTTNTNPTSPPTPTPDWQRLAETYDPLPEERESTHTPPPAPRDAESRLAAAYARETTDPDADAGGETNDAGEASPPKADDTETPPTRYVLDDPETQTALTDVARDLNLDDKAVQRLVDKMGPVLDARATKRVRDVAAGWDRDTRADSEIGGARLDETLFFAKKAMALGTPALRELLGGGLGNHPEIVRWAAAIGRRLAAAERPPNNLPPNPGEEKLAAREGSPEPRRSASPTRTPLARTATAEERLARSYRQV